MGYQTGTVNQMVVILLAPGFEEGPTIFCADRMREAGIRVSLVGLAAGAIPGIHGIVVFPDYSLEQLPDRQSIHLLVIPGGGPCVSSLLMDPRVHHLFDQVIRNQGKIALMATAERPLRRAGISPLFEPTQFISQGKDDVRRFSDRLVQSLQFVVPASEKLPIDKHKLAG